MLISLIITTDNFQRYLKTAIVNILSKYLAIPSLGIVMFFNTGIAQGQITPAIDDTNTIINQNGDRFDINGGSLSGDGSNLFHSFQEFGLDSNQIANFLSNPNIRNILSRVVGNDPSIINGLIQISGGNSNLFLLNPAGIIFGNNAQLNIPGSFTATTATGIGLNDSWFNAFGENNYTQLAGDPNGFRFDNQSGVIVNAGNLELSPEQNLSLIGSSVINTGTLKTSGGNITIAAVEGTNRVILTQEEQILGLEIEIPTDNQNNSLPITPLMLPELLTGTNVNTGLTVNSNNQVQTTTGTNIPTDLGTAISSGTIDTSQIGGSINVLGQQVALIDSAQINASGNDGGGTVLIGGDYQGQGNVPNALQTFVGSNVNINADALSSGDGGTVIVWADNSTHFFGNISARGGVNGGDGGFVEISGKNYLDFNGTVDTSAFQGNVGTLLFDPVTLTILDDVDSSGDGDSALPNLNTDDFEGTVSTVSWGAIRNQLVSNNVILETDGDVQINDITGNAGLPVTENNLVQLDSTTTSLTITANNGDIFFEDTNDTIQTQGGGIIFQAMGSGGNINIGNLETNGGLISLQADTSSTNSISTSTGNLDTSAITGGGAIDIDSLSDNGNTITIGIINTSSSNGDGGQIDINADSGFSIEAEEVINSVSTGDIDSSSNNGNGGDVNINANGFAFTDINNSSIDIGNINSSGNGGSGGQINLNAFSFNNSTIDTGDLNSSGNGGDGGQVNIGSSGSNNSNIVTGNINSSANDGNGGQVNIGSSATDTSISTGNIDSSSDIGNAGAISLDSASNSSSESDMPSSEIGNSDITIGDINASSISGDGGSTSINSFIDPGIEAPPLIPMTIITGNIDTSSQTGGGGDIVFTSQDIIAIEGSPPIVISSPIGETLVLESDRTFNAGTGSIIFNNIAIQAGNNNLTLTANEIDFEAFPFSRPVSGSGDLILQPFTPSLDIAVGGFDSESNSILNLTDGDLGLLQDGFNSITIGREDSSGTITVVSNIALPDILNFNDSLTLQSPASGGIIEVNREINTNGNSLTLNAENTVDINTSIDALNGTITIRSNEINLNGGTNSIQGGNLLLQPANPNQNIAIGDTTDSGITSLDLLNTDIAALADGFTSITIGTSEGSGIVTLFDSVANGGSNPFLDTVNLAGGSTLIGANLNTIWNISGSDAGDLNSIFANGFNFTNIENLTGGNQADNFTLTDLGSLSGTVDGVGGNDTLTGDNDGNTFTITGNNQGTLTGKTSGWSNIENLTGGEGEDSFTLSDSGSLDGTVDGGGGNDTLTGDNDGNTFTITGNNQGTLTGKTSGWSNIENLTGGEGEDSFTLSDSGSLDGTVDGGGGNDTLTGDNDGNTFTITGNNQGTLTGKTSGWSNIENLTGGEGEDSFTLSDSGSLDGTVDGGGGNDTLTGDNDGNNFTITGNNQGTLTGKTSGWSNIENLTGGEGEDSFTLSDSGSLDGTVDGGGGNDTLTGDNDSNTFTITGNNQGTLTGKTSGWSNIENLTGGEGEDSFTLSDSGSLDGTVDGGGGNDTLTGDNDGNTFTITGNNQGTLTGKTSGWSNIENLTGGEGEDSFTLSDSGSLDGTVDGGGGNDTLTGDNDSNNFTITGNNQGTLTGKTSGWSNIENLTGGEGEDSFTLSDSGSLDGTVDGGGGNDTLTGDNNGNNFTITGNNQGTLTGKTSGWSNIENLTGGDANDTFSFNGSTVSISGNLDGANGSLDTLEYSDYTGGSVTVQPGTTTPGNATGVGGTISNFEQAIGNNNPDNILIGEDNPNTWNITGSGNIDEVFIFDGFENLVGGNNNDVFILSGGIATTIDGGTGDNTLVGGNQVNSWQITSTNSGSVTGVDSFTNIQNLTGGNTDDNFQFIGAQARIDGNIDGVEIVDTLDYSEFTGEEVTVNLGTNSLGTATGVGGTILSIEDVTIPPTEPDLNLDEINPVDITQIPEVPDAPPNPQVNNPLIIDPIVAQLDATFTSEFENYLGLDDVSNVTLDQEQQILQNIEQATGIKPALLYVVFAPSTLPPASPTASNNSALKENTSEKSQLLPEDSDELEVVLVTAQGSPVRRRLGGVTRKQVLEITRVFHSTITNTRRPNAYLEPSQQLYQWIVAPVEEVLQTKEINNIAFLMDQGLRSLPLAALHDGNGFLIEKYSVGLMPSISLIDTRYVSVKDLEVLAMGAEEFTDQNPLPGVPKELSTITEELWSGKSFLNEDFTINNLQQVRSVTPFGIVHLATHGEFKNGKPSESYIQLWDKKLGLDNIRQLGLHNPPAELMVLSACRTALGDKEAELGFAGLAVQTGVKSAVGSLWSVSDEGTLGLMTIFYEELKKAPIKAEALRQAQLAIISGELKIEDGLLRRRSGDEITLPPALANLQKIDLTHPYYWSAFTLIGNPW